MSSSLTNAQIQKLWIQNGGSASAAPLMAAIAMAESSGNTTAHNTKAPDNSVGLWQVNYYGGLASSRTAAYGSPSALLSDPNLQAKAAIDIYKSQGLSAWSTYTSGAYKNYLSGSSAAATSTLPVTGSSTSSTTAGTETGLPSTTAGLETGLGALPGAASASATADQSAIYSQRCLISAPSLFGIGGGCLLSKAEGRVLLGGALMVAGGFVCTVGLILLTAYGLEASGAASAGAKSAKLLGGAATLVGLPEIGLPLAAGGSAVDRHEKTRKAKTDAVKAQRAEDKTARRQAEAQRQAQASARVA